MTWTELAYIGLKKRDPTPGTAEYHRHVRALTYLMRRACRPHNYNRLNAGSSARRIAAVLRALRC